MKKVLVLLAAAFLLAACSGTSSGAASSPTSSSPTASASGTPPSAEQTAWAGQVCTAAAELKTSIQGLATAATADGGDAKARMSAQLDTIKTSVNTLVQTVAAAPAGTQDDPDLAPVQASAQQLRASIDALETSITNLQSSSGAASAVALAAVVTAGKAALTALSTTAQAVDTAAKDRKGTLGQAFAASSSCTSLAQ